MVICGDLPSGLDRKQSVCLQQGSQTVDSGRITGVSAVWQQCQTAVSEKLQHALAALSVTPLAQLSYARWQYLSASPAREQKAYQLSHRTLIEYTDTAR